jgi:hypothetical protein
MDINSSIQAASGTRRIERPQEASEARAPEPRERRAQESDAQPERPNAASRATLAVRTGPAPIESFAVDPAGAEDLLRESLRSRAAFRDLEAVLAPARDLVSEQPSGASAEGSGSAKPEPTETTTPSTRSPEPRETSDGSDAPERMPPLMGEGRDENVDETLPPRRPLPPTTDAFEPISAGPAVPSTRSQIDRDAELEERAAEQRTDEPQDLERAAAVAPQAAPLPTLDENRAHTGADPSISRAAGSEVARSVLTDAGVVEAQAEDEIVSRFIDRLPAHDVGPEPAPREYIDQRSTPVRIRV